MAYGVFVCLTGSPVPRVACTKRKTARHNIKTIITSSRNRALTNASSGSGRTLERLKSTQAGQCFKCDRTSSVQQAWSPSSSLCRPTSITARAQAAKQETRPKRLWRGDARRAAGSSGMDGADQAARKPGAHHRYHGRVASWQGCLCCVWPFVRPGCDHHH